MKWRSLFYVVSGLILAGFLAACNGGSQKNTTAVTVAVGGGTTAHKAGVSSKATPAVAFIIFTITGPGMDTIVREVPVTPPQTINEVFYILNGPDRKFVIEACDASRNPVYSNSLLANLDGTPVAFHLPLQAMLFNNLIWTPYDDVATSIAKNLDGTMIIAGYTYGDFGKQNADRTHQKPDIFVSKLTSTGGTIWRKQFGTKEPEECYSAATDSVGNVYLTGSTVVLSSGYSKAFVKKLTSSGNLLWTRSTGTALSDTSGNALTVDSAGNAYVTGYTNADLAGNGNAGGYDIFVAKYNTSGVLKWMQQQGTSGDDAGNGIAVDPTGRVVIAGSMNAAGYVGGATEDLFVSVLNSIDGAPLWIQQFGSTSDDSALAVAVDQNSGDIYTTGWTEGDLDGNLNANTNPNIFSSDLFVVKYNSAGVKQWTRQLGSTENDVAAGIVIDSLGNVVVTGSTSGVFDSISGDGLNDVFLVKYDASGGKVWTQELGTKAEDYAAGVLVDASDSLVVIGNTFGGFTSSATEDIFLLKYDASGVQQ